MWLMVNSACVRLIYMSSVGVRYLHDVHHSPTGLLLVSGHDDSLPGCQTAGLHHQGRKVGTGDGQQWHRLSKVQKESLSQETHLEQMLYCRYKTNNVFCGLFSICRANHCGCVRLSERGSCCSAQDGLYDQRDDFQWKVCLFCCFFKSTEQNNHHFWDH